VAEAYCEVLRAERLVAIAEGSAAKAKRLRESSGVRARVGLATELDVLRADLVASQAEASLLTFREDRDNALDALASIMGRAAGSVTQLAGIDFDAVGEPPADTADALIASAQASRFDAREARERIRDARRGEAVARWNLLPSMNLDASYTRRGLGAGAFGPYGDMMSGFRFGLGTTYSLDRSDESAAAASAAVSVRAAEREAQEVERRVADEVRRAFRSGVRARLAVDLQHRAVGIAERQLRLAQIRYEQGVAGNFDMIDAQHGLDEAEAALVNARIDRFLADLALRRAAGLLDPGSVGR
jgi:outer membrane protein TolC